MRQNVAELLAEIFPELDAMQYYNELFPAGSLERSGETGTTGKYCSIAIQIRSDGSARRYQVTDGLKELPDLIKSDHFTMIAPCSFAGRNATIKNARYLHALQFDLDFLRVDKNGDIVGLENLLYQMSIGYEDPFHRLPKPTYILATNDRNIHVVYLLDKPIAMFHNTANQVRLFRKAFIPKLWDSYICEEYKHPQFEISPVQQFRLCGSKSKNGKDRVRCFRAGGTVTIDELNQYVEEKAQIKEYVSKNKYTLEKAKKLYPEWYERRIEQRIPPNGWIAHRGLYDWFKNKLPEIQVGHRYHYLICLSAFAKKCNISYEELKKDVMAARKELDKISPPNNKLTISDATKALQGYSEEYRTMSRETISILCGIPIKASKRNGRKQADHLKLARAIKKAKLDLGEESVRGGLPSKQALVYAALDQDPDLTIAELSRNLQINRKTASKHLKTWKEKQNT